MNENVRRKLIDHAALHVLGGVAVAAYAVKTGALVFLIVAWLMIRWGVVRAVAAARLPADKPAAGEPYFGYEPDGPVR